MANCKYLFFHQKYKVGHILETWPVTDICFLIENIKQGIYLHKQNLYGVDLSSGLPFYYIYFNLIQSISDLYSSIMPNSMSILIFFGVFY